MGNQHVWVNKHVFMLQGLNQMGSQDLCVFGQVDVCSIIRTALNIDLNNFFKVLLPMDQKGG